MNSIYFDYHLWIAGAIFFVLGGIKFLLYDKKEGTRPFAIGAFIVAVVLIILIINSPSLSNRIEYFNKYSTLEVKDLEIVNISGNKFDRGVRVLNLQNDINQLLENLKDASSSYFSFGSGKVKKNYKIELKTKSGNTYFVTIRVHDQVAFIDLSIGDNKEVVGRYVSADQHFFLNL